MNVNNNSEVFKGSSPTSATKNFRINLRKLVAMAGQPVDLVEGRISFLLGFQDSSFLRQSGEPRKTRCHAP